MQPYFHQNRLQSHHFNHWLQSLPAKYRPYSLASPKPVTESTHLAHLTVLILGQVDVEAFTRITSTGYGVYRPGAGLHSPYFDSQRKLQVLETRKASLL